MAHGLLRSACGAMVIACAASVAVGQCPNLRWTSEFGGAAGLVQGTGAGLAAALQVFDPDGPGPAASELFAGGYFQPTAGVPARALARWDGVRWADVGGGLLPNTSATHI